MPGVSGFVLEEQEEKEEEDEEEEVAENPIPNSPHIQVAQDPRILLDLTSLSHSRRGLDCVIPQLSQTPAFSPPLE